MRAALLNAMEEVPLVNAVQEMDGGQFRMPRAKRGTRDEMCGVLL